MQLTALDYWKFHRGIIDVPKKKPKSYSLIYRNGVVVLHDKPFQYCATVKKQHPLAIIKPNF